MVFCHELMEDIGICGCKSTCTRINGLADIAVFPELLHDPIIVGSFLTQKVQSVHIVMPVIRVLSFRDVVVDIDAIGLRAGIIVEVVRLVIAWLAIFKCGAL